MLYYVYNLNAVYLYIIFFHSQAVKELMSHLNLAVKNKNIK